MSDVYQPAYLTPDEDSDATVNDTSLPMWKRVGLQAPPSQAQPVGDINPPITPAAEIAPSGRLRVNVSPPKVDPNYKPAYLNPDQQPSFMSSPNANVTGGQAFGAGLAQGGTFGLAPLLVGLAKAGETNPAAIKMPLGVPSEAPGLENVGAGAQALYAGNPEAQAAFEHGRQAVLQELQAAGAQHPFITGAGEVTGAIAGAPIPGAGMGATVPARMASGAIAGGAIGSVYGAGSAIGEGAPPGEVAARAATGGIMGAAGGAVVPPVLAGAGAATKFVGDRVGAVLGHPIQALTASRNIDETAAQRIAGSLRYDAENATGGMSAADVAAAHAQGQSPALMDVGGAATQELTRSSANSSPAGRAALEGVVSERFKTQSQRVSDFVRSLVPTPANADRTQETLEQAARIANRPAYQRAYAAGDRPIWSPELERLTNSPTVAGAVRGAISRWKDFQVRDGFGGANPPLRVTLDGQLQSTGGKGMLPYPNIQLWDYAQRILSGKAAAASRAGNKTNAGLFGGLADQVKSALDAAVPEFGEARAGASAFFKAQNALEAGRNFVTMRGSLEGARQAIGKMSAPERALFAEGFVSDLADKVSKIADNRSVTIDRIFNSPDGRARIAMALGPDRAGQLEAFLRREDMMDLARKAVTGNSTTVRQLMMKSLANAGGHGAVGGAIGAGVDEILNGEVDWKHVLMGGVLAGTGIATTAVNAKLAQSIAEKLASDDPKVWGQVLRIAARNPEAAAIIRRGEGFLEKITGQVASKSPPLLTAQPAAANQQQ